MPEHSSTSPPSPPALPERLTRTVDMLGPLGTRRLVDARVLIAGLGGVGSHAAMALARSGVGTIHLVDFDVVSISSLNRHAVALAADVGQLKVEVLARHLRGLDPAIRVEADRRFIDAESVHDLLASEPDYVVDAIDSLNPKVSLLAACVARDRRVVSSMGASSRSDPTMIAIRPLEQTHVCPLAKHVRKRLRSRGVPLETITAVFSHEHPRDPLPPDPTEPRHDRGRLRNRLPSLATLPGIFGYALASVVIRDLAGE